MINKYTAARTSLRTAGIMFIFTVLFTTLMSSMHRLTLPSIQASEQAERMRLINEILPPDTYNNKLLEDFVRLGPTPELGITGSARVYRARLDDQAAALIVEAIAPDGYAGRIELAVAVSNDGRISGIRATSHKETPGLGDYIDPRKDKNRNRPWITQFNGMGYDQVVPEKWRVRRDGGVFDYHIGATISARAVTNMSGQALSFANSHREALFDAASGSLFMEKHDHE